MKCRKCGVHYDDGDRICPMCGARNLHIGIKAGRPGSEQKAQSTQAVPVPPENRQKTGWNAGRAGGELPRARTVMAEMSPATKAWVIRCIAMLALVCGIMVVQLIGLGINAGSSASGGFSLEPMPQEGASYGYVTYYGAMQGMWSAEYPDGGALSIRIDDKDVYDLLYLSPEGWKYQESGEIYLYWNDPADEVFFQEEYDSTGYESYFLELERESFSSVSSPESFLENVHRGQIEFLMYQAHGEKKSYVLAAGCFLGEGRDAFGSTSAIFPQEPVELALLEGG